MIRTLLPLVVVEEAMVVLIRAVLVDRIEAEAVEDLVDVVALTEAAEEVVVQEAAWGRCLTMSGVYG